MPPKSKAAAALPTIDQLHEIKGRMDTAPDAADYAKVLAGVRGDEQIKSLVARLVQQYNKLFPKARKDSIGALKTLAADSSSEVRIYALKGLKEFFSVDSPDVCNAVYAGLASEDSHVVDSASKLVLEAISANDAFKQAFIGQIKGQEPVAQVKMVEIAQEKIQFTEENVDALLSLIEVCFTANVEQGLKLMRKNKKVINEEKKAPLVNTLIENLDASLDSNFEEVTSSLLPSIMFYIPTLGQAGKIMKIVAAKVLPKFDSVSIENRIKILHLIADNAKLSEDSGILEALYNNVYIMFPKTYGVETKINFSLMEAALYAFFRLSRRFSRKASELIGELLVISGQPNENEGITENAEKKEEFHSRLENVDPIAEQFVNYWRTRVTAFKESAATKTEAEKKKELSEASIAIRTGNNVRHFCRILRMENFITQNPPKDVSWRKPKAREQKKDKNFKGKNQRGSKPQSDHRERKGADFKPRNSRFQKNGSRNQRIDHH